MEGALRSVAVPPLTQLARSRLTLKTAQAARRCFFGFSLWTTLLKDVLDMIRCQNRIKGLDPRLG